MFLVAAHHSQGEVQVVFQRHRSYRVSLLQAFCEKMVAPLEVDKPLVEQLFLSEEVYNREDGILTQREQEEVGALLPKRKVYFLVIFTMNMAHGLISGSPKSCWLLATAQREQVKRSLQSAPSMTYRV